MMKHREVTPRLFSKLCSTLHYTGVNKLVYVHVAASAATTLKCVFVYDCTHTRSALTEEQTFVFNARGKCSSVNICFIVKLGTQMKAMYSTNEKGGSKRTLLSFVLSIHYSFIFILFFVLFPFLVFFYPYSKRLSAFTLICTVESCATH
uniref:Uncharacterized protein n=1 Tax=Trypanosoma vivax (strain Y486) TaxID=1055687 RepID=G0U850_TRYVY|nr:hypothetical protein, unlikely [Trypanosoma vivax Y486]